MVLAMDFRRQAQVCARLAADCEDRQLAGRFRKLAADLLAKAVNELGTKIKTVRNRRATPSGCGTYPLAAFALKREQNAQGRVTVPPSNR